MHGFPKQPVTIEDFRELFALINKKGQEDAHIYADEALEAAALSTTLTAEERVEIVKLYNQKEKWYA